MHSKLLLAFLCLLLPANFTLALQPTQSGPKKDPSSQPKKIEEIVGAMEASFTKMHRLQLAVHDGIKDLQRSIEANDDKKPNSKNKQAAVDWSRKQNDISEEAASLLKLLKSEGAAVAFPEVVEWLWKDMKQVMNRLEACDTGPETRAIEKELLDSLKEMLDSLQKKHGG